MIRQVQYIQVKVKYDLSLNQNENIKIEDAFDSIIEIFSLRWTFEQRFGEYILAATDANRKLAHKEALIIERSIINALIANGATIDPNEW